MIIIYTLLSVLTISLVSFIGVFTLILKRNLLNKSIFILVSLAVGTLLGDVFIHIIPEAYEKISNSTLISFLIIGGILIFFVLEKVLHWHHHTLEHAEEHHHPIGKMILLGDGVHNFIDGLIIATSYMISIEIGVATTMAVILHEIPQEIGNFGVLIHAGYKTKKALWYNFLSALTAVAGAVTALLFGNITEQFALWLLPLTAGGFIYIALSDLVPELHKDFRVGQGIIQVIAIMVGVASMLMLLALEG
ncbi:ZIP family metal transporter [Candidatus Kaiserbacteria bacterium CG_4_9_14_0_2_um_filter_41_32]|uniref:ZIP family metal transporter n=1 Tax=Candidatus Kaiserbacteria bacterium CG_4_9_14_0_2_um_filter_41_32 TaxID=1974601 RepID=A0A2M8FF46_9BACT|nr:MAG: ZIP family metal transporter [Candidatus Kaiserbacteria bacterium CG_4_9_14_0_2_um_filter_41_32]